MRLVRIAFAGLVLIALLGLEGGAQAQSSDGIWDSPVNLSQSGAAEQPRIVEGPAGTAQVFWWDRFDGIVTTTFDGETWSDPSVATIPLTAEMEEAGLSQAVTEMPVIVSDGSGRVRALWLGAPEEETGVRALMHSELSFGSSSWSSPERLGASAVAFDVTRGPTGTLTLAYVRTLHTDGAPAGIYVRQIPRDGQRWESSTALYQTIYFRLLSERNAYLRVAEGSDGRIHAIWEDPRQQKTLYARSVDGGVTWTEPVPLGKPDERPTHPRVLTLRQGDALRLWDTPVGTGGCTVYQQRLLGADATATVWGDPERAIETSGRCPEGERSWLRDDGLLWLWGEGSSTLTLTAWDGSEERWSEPRSVNLRFENPETGRWLILQNLRAALPGPNLIVVGSEPGDGEVWATMTNRDAMSLALELAFAPPSPWSNPVRLSQEDNEVEWADVALDANGGVHVAWSERQPDIGSGAAVLYAYRDSSTSRWSRAVDVAAIAFEGETVRQPALDISGEGLIHLVWSGGKHGEIHYSRAEIGQAVTSGGWSPPRTVSVPGAAASWPQIEVDELGFLHVVYAVPLNEGRGIYSVRSTDGGLSWSDPEVVFSAQSAGWAMVDHPALTVANDGTRHVAWTRAPLPGTGLSQGIYYRRLSVGTISEPSSPDSSEGVAAAGSSASVEPEVLAGAGWDWPQLALAGGRLHLICTDADGAVLHRQTETRGEAAGGWSTSLRISELRPVRGPTGLAVDDGGTLHLVGAALGREGLFYTAYDGESWSSVESFALEPEAEAGLRAAAATLPGGGQLAVGLGMELDEEGETESALYYAARRIPTVTVSTPSTLTTSTPVQIPTAQAGTDDSAPVLKTLTPTPTQDPTTRSEPSGPPIDPRLLGGGVAAVIVGGALLTRSLWDRRR